MECPYCLDSNGNHTIFTAQLSNILNGNTHHCGCQTSKSRGENKLQKIFDELNIKYQREKTFDDLLSLDGKHKYRFDFYLYELNTIIEYDGKQHFISDTGYGKDLTNIQFRDSIKNDYCVKNNLNLIRIPYTDYDILDKDYIIDKLKL